jgi:hypothetical protein
MAKWVGGDYSTGVDRSDMDWGELENGEIKKACRRIVIQAQYI